MSGLMGSIDQCWLGKQVLHHLQTLATGYTELDASLPGHGWPVGAITELIHARAGSGELSLLLPALAQLSRQNHWIVMVDPPWVPYPPALHGHGLALDKLLLVRSRSRNESLWACEQVLRGIPGGAVLAWPESLSFSELRRLQLAARQSQKTAFIFRRSKAATTASPAALRLLLTPEADGLQIRVLKCRGQRPTTAIRIPTLQLLMPPLVSSSGSSKRASSASVSPVVSLATSRIGRPSL